MVSTPSRFLMFWINLFYRCGCLSFSHQMSSILVNKTTYFTPSAVGEFLKFLLKILCCEGDSILSKASQTLTHRAWMVKSWIKQRPLRLVKKKSYHHDYSVRNFIHNWWITIITCRLAISKATTTHWDVEYRDVQCGDRSGWVLSITPVMENYTGRMQSTWHYHQVGGRLIH